MRPPVDEVLKERGKVYGNTWLVASQTVNFLLMKVGEGNMLSLMMTPYFHNWFQILGKVIRILFSPHDPDHWRDISGYAILVLNHMEELPGAVNDTGMREVRRD